MDFFGGYKSPFGYENGDNGVDSYGVDHSGFSTQDELQYQTARTNREQQLADDLQQQGIAEENYPQYGLSFWGNSANNYGFGVRNIAQNTQNHPTMNMTPTMGLLQQQVMQENNQQSMWNGVKSFAQNAVDAVAPYTPTYYMGYGVGSIHADLRDQNGYINNVRDIIGLNNVYNPMRVNDKYKHAMVNCLMAQKGPKSEKVAQIISGLKENYDVFMGKNTSQASDEDMEANIYGREIARNYPNGNCHELVSQRYKP